MRKTTDVLGEYEAWPCATVKDVHGRRYALEDGESRNLQISETVNWDVRADREGVMQGLPLSNTDSSLQSKEMKQSQ